MSIFVRFGLYVELMYDAYVWLGGLGLIVVGLLLYLLDLSWLLLVFCCAT